MAAGFPEAPDYRLEAGEFLLLLTRLGDGAYRAVDRNYSFMPAKNGMVEWVADQGSNKSEWIAADEALRRIKEFRTKEELRKKVDHSGRTDPR